MRMPHTSFMRWAAALLVAHTLPLVAADPPARFDVNDAGGALGPGRLIQPWKIVALEKDHGGRWVVAGDLDGDGQAEIVSAENFNAGDVHYTSAVAAQKLDGTVLWTWGDPAIGRKEWHHDVACQIADLDLDGRNEVIVATKGFVVRIDGKTGQDIGRFAIEEEATDCIVVCNLRGNPGPQDLLVKDRYRRIWAYDAQGNLLWTVTDPGGHRTAHQPVPLDIDGDGRDEIMAGYAMLNHDGSLRWVATSRSIDLRRGHLDCMRILRRGQRPQDWRLVLTCCGANGLLVIDGEGRTLWERTGHHFESIKIGRVFGDIPGPQIVVDIDHRPFGDSPLWILDDQGALHARITTDYSRHHALLDWTGDGLDEIVVAYDGEIYDHRGRRIATLAVPGAHKGGRQPVEQQSILLGDMDGDGVPDVLIVTNTAVTIYRNENGARPKRSVPLGTGPNVTLY